MRSLLVAPIAALFLAGSPAVDAVTGNSFMLTAAIADDGDDGGDDGDDGGGGGGYSGSGATGESGSRGSRGAYRGNPLRDIRRALTPRFFGRSAPRRSGRSARARPAQPLPTRADRELVALGLTQPNLDQLTTAGFTVVERSEVATIGGSVSRLRAPDGVELSAAREQVRAVNASSSVDFNHFYRPEQTGVPLQPAVGNEAACEGRHCVAPALIGWPGLLGAAGCRADVRIGLIDTAINPDHLTFENSRFEITRLSDDELPESGRQHGTAVAALLVGSARSRTPGLLPGATLVAVDAFHRAGRQDDRADLFSLVRAIDEIAGSNVAVLNMSLSGPANILLEKAVAEAIERRIVIVAAVGNGGPKADPLYPAAYPDVFAVTAVDGRKRVYRRAGQGEHVDIAAPGVDIWTAASIEGARPKTGTSFAAPFVTAAAAMVKAANPEMTPAEVHERLTGSAEDLGQTGKDSIFGWGLVDASGVCGTATPVTAGGEPVGPAN